MSAIISKMNRKVEPCGEDPRPTTATSTGGVNPTSSLVSATSHEAEPLRSVHQEPGTSRTNPTPVFVPLVSPFVMTPPSGLMTSQPVYVPVMGSNEPQVPLTTGAGVVPLGINSGLATWYQPMLTEKAGPLGSIAPTPQTVDSGRETFSCRECNKSYASLNDLDHHHLMVHTQETSFRCSGCGKRFATKSQLVSHKTAQTKTHPCAKCGKILSGYWDVQLHEKMHTGKNAPPCSIMDTQESGQSLTLSPSVTRQLMRLEKTRVVKKPYSCPECGKCFARDFFLTIHQQLHNRKPPFSCSDCGKPFFSFDSFVRHRGQHTI